LPSSVPDQLGNAPAWRTRKPPPVIRLPLTSPGQLARSAKGFTTGNLDPAWRWIRIAHQKGVLLVVEDHWNILLTPSRPQGIAEFALQMKSLRQARFIRIAELIVLRGMRGKQTVAQSRDTHGQYTGQHNAGCCI
jgi:hypothetical protein